MTADLESGKLGRPGPFAVAPLWQVKRLAEPTALQADASCDTVVVGGGVCGLAAAAELADDREVILLEGRCIGEGSTGWSAGILASATTVDFDRLQCVIGEQATREFLFFLTDAIAQIKQTVQLDESDWQFGHAIYIEGKRSHRALLEKELESRRRFGLPAAWLDHPDLLKPWPGVGSAIEMADEQACHPVKLALSLAQRIEGLGGRIYEQSPVSGWSHDGEAFSVRCGDHLVRAVNLVFAGGLKSAPAGAFRRLSAMAVPVTSHIVVTEPSTDWKKTVKDGGRIALWNSFELYNYVRYLADGRILIGGADEPGPAPPAVIPVHSPPIRALYQWAQSHHKKKLPPPEYAWRASLSVPVDGMPAIQVRRLNDSLLVGLSADGLPSSFLLGNVASALVKKGEHPLAGHLSAERPLGTGASMLACLPPGSPWREAALKAGFSLLSLKDRFG